MLLGCCHCEDEASSSSSVVASSSVVPSSNEISSVEPACADGVCIGGVIARKYNISYAFGSSSGCGGFYQGTFPVGEVPPNGYCNLTSQAYGLYAKYFSGGICNQWPSYRFNALFSSSGGYVLVNVLTHSTGVYAQQGIGYILLAGFPNNPVPVNCLGTLTLTRLTSYTTAQLEQFARNIVGPSGSSSHVPNTLTLTPF